MPEFWWINLQMHAKMTVGSLAHLYRLTHKFEALIGQLSLRIIENIFILLELIKMAMGYPQLKLFTQ